MGKFLSMTCKPHHVKHTEVTLAVASYNKSFSSHTINLNLRQYNGDANPCDVAAPAVLRPSARMRYGYIDISTSECPSPLSLSRWNRKGLTPSIDHRLGDEIFRIDSFNYTNI